MADAKILVVDDELQITRVLRRSLESQGYEVRTASDGNTGLAEFETWHPDLIVTDLSMPHMGGLELCRRIRALSGVPMIVLSVKQEENTKILALDSGADDYVTKPFGIDELLARVRAALRRSPPSEGSETGVIEIGDFVIDLPAHSATVRGQPVRLTPKEYELLVYLARHAGKVLTHRSLLIAIWGPAYAQQTESLRVFIGQLRKKIEPDPANPQYVLTEPWIGYRFQPGAQVTGV